jgi:hypothetical protein
MSVFELSDIAHFLEKNDRTLRRWCQEERVPGAFCTGGGKRGIGHWRIRGESLQAVVESVRRAAPKNARRRKESAYPGAIVTVARSGLGMWLRMDSYVHRPTIPRDTAYWWGKRPTPREVWRRFFERNPAAAIFQQGVRKNPKTHRMRMVHWYTGKLETYDLRLKTQRERFLADAVEGFKACKAEAEKSSEKAAKRFKQSISATAVARTAGIPLRTFLRWFPGWRRKVNEGVKTLPSMQRGNRKPIVPRNFSGSVHAFEDADDDSSAVVESVWFDYDSVRMPYATARSRVTFEGTTGTTA